MPLGAALFRRYWIWRRGKVIEGINAEYARAVTEAIQAIDPSVKVLCTGGFQHASAIAGRDPLRRLRRRDHRRGR